MPERDMLREQEKMDDWLRQAMSAAPVPASSGEFDARLAKRLRPPRRLSSAGRLVLVAYTLIAIAVAIWVMRSQAMTWPLIAVPCIAPVVITTAVYRRRLYFA
jgi:hypothetical protein